MVSLPEAGSYSTFLPKAQLGKPKNLAIIQLFGSERAQNSDPTSGHALHEQD